MIKGRTSSAFVLRIVPKDKPAPAEAVAPSSASLPAQAPPRTPAPAQDAAVAVEAAVAEIRASLLASLAVELAVPSPDPTSAPVVAEDARDTALTAPLEDTSQPLANRPPLADSAITASLLDTIASGLGVDPDAPSPPPWEPRRSESAVPLTPPAQVSDGAVPAESVEPLVAADPVAPAPQPASVDEDDAMRAIEGGWSRRQTRAMSGAPELGDVGAAVAAAQLAVETVLARSGIDAARSSDLGKPRGLPRPRNGKRDNLQAIRGLGQLDETALNNLGVFHFDQVAEWDQRSILWLENHAFARGRIAREEWQAHARALIGDASDIRVLR